MECHRPDRKSSPTVEDARAEIIDDAGDEGNAQWIRLTTGKEFSRILYPNPVCFLSTSRGAYNSRARASPSASSTFLKQTNGTAAAAISGLTVGPSRIDEGAANNVMVLSWLTPTNNRGRFVFSMHKSRYSASLLAPSRTSKTRTVDKTISTAIERTDDEEVHTDDANAEKANDGTASRNDEDGENEGDATDNVANNDFHRTGIEFTLSVPVRGMEQLVLDVGSISGRHRSKFPPTEGIEPGSQGKGDDAVAVDRKAVDNESMSVRRRKKRRRQRLSENGVTGLIPAPLGYLRTKSDAYPFAIEGTVAHVLCRTYAVVGSPHSHPRSYVASNGSISTTTESSPIIDEDHLLVLAEVTDAYVHPSYWDDTKSIFRPLSEDVPPYLTFLGSQTFG